MIDEDRAVEQPTSIVMTEVNGVRIPTKSVGRCHTCQSPHRNFIETQLVNARSYRAIAKSLEDLQPGHLPHPSVSAIKQHALHHLPLARHVHREMVERRAIQMGKDVAEEPGGLLDYVVLNEMILHRGLERLTSGEIQPDVKDLIAAIGMQHKIEETADGGYDALAWQQAMFVYMDIAKQFIPPEQFADYGRALSRNPMLRALAAKQTPTDDTVTVAALPSREEIS